MFSATHPWRLVPTDKTFPNPFRVKPSEPMKIPCAAFTLIQVYFFVAATKAKCPAVRVNFTNTIHPALDCKFDSLMDMTLFTSLNFC